MRKLYIDCSMGAAGDMMAAALLELVPDPASMLSRLNALGIPGVSYSSEKVPRGGIIGTRLHVHVNGEEEGHEHEHEHAHEHGHVHEHHHHHEHHSLHDILGIVDGLALPDAAKRHVAEIYRMMADAESRAHGRPVGEVHFHEVGAMDAVADISAVCLLMDEIGADEVIASPVNVGGGTVRCAHGVMPVPAPATAYLLEGASVYSSEPAVGELCTPTGAALLRHFARSFGSMPPLRVSSIGYGAGGRDVAGRANLLRVLLGEADGACEDDVFEISCNVDDMTGEEISFACERIFAAGALDVATIPAQMKKGRPGIIFSVLCKSSVHDDVMSALFRHTTTIGARETLCRRHVMARREEKVALPGGGSARRKISEGWGVKRVKTEFEDLARVARDAGSSLREAAETLS